MSGIRFSQLYTLYGEIICPTGLSDDGQLTVQPGMGPLNNAPCSSATFSCS